MRTYFPVHRAFISAACGLLLVASLGCHSERAPTENEVFDQSQRLFQAYLKSDLATARDSLREEIALLEHPKVPLEGVRQATVLFLECARLYTLEKRSGRDTNAELALIKARYWNIRRFELDGTLTEKAWEELRSFTPERLIEITDASDKTHTSGKGPKYVRKD